MESVLVDVLGLTTLLTLAVLMLPVARRLNFPYTVFLALVGIGLGVVILFGGKSVGEGPVADLLTATRNVGITSDVIFFVFLPALVFESSLAIDARRLLDDVGPILFLAVVGLLISTVAVGYAVHLASGAALLVCLLLGAIVSATDPVAVVAIFKELGAPKRLAILVEGESLFNDATAIVMFNILAAMILGAATVDVAGGAFSFVKVFAGGIIVGYVMARLFCAILARLRDSAMVEITLTVTLAYFSFVIAEHYLHLSGVMAVVTSALVLGSRGRTAISESTWHGLQETWELIGFWANSLIFLLVGMAVPSILMNASQADWWVLVVLALTAVAARFVLVGGFVPVLTRMGLASRVSRGFRAVMVWGGLRGAVSLALALVVVENPAFDPEVRRFIMTMVTGFVLITLFVKAPTIPWLMRLLALDRLSPADVAIRNRAMGRSLAEIGERVAQVAAEQGALGASTAELQSGYRERKRELAEESQQLSQLSADDWVVIGLNALLNRERQIYLKWYGDGILNSALARKLVGRTDDIIDASKGDGIAGYRAEFQRSVGFDTAFRLALLAQHRLGWSRSLEVYLADRFETLRAMRAALLDVQAGAGSIASFVGVQSADRLRDLLSERLVAVEAALDALTAQYPEYAAALEQRYLQQVAIRLEEANYDELYRSAVISTEVHRDLTASLKAKAREAARRPDLDLGLRPEQLVSKVPMFAGLDRARIERIAKMLKPYFAVPGERIVRMGEAGDSMYFISSGCLEVDVSPTPVQLANGDFFGELSLLRGQPRTANVRAMGYCDLLILSARDFDKLLAAEPEMRAELERKAAIRLKENALG